MPTTRKALITARNLIVQGWTQGAYARNSEGAPVESIDPTAVSWCIRGAARKVCNIDSYSEKSNWHTWNEMLLKLEKCHGTTFLADWNDEPSRTKEEVLALFDRAISQE